MRKDLRSLDPWFAKHRRTTWIPVVKGRDGAPSDSKFGGTPLITQRSPWPRCGRCHNEMTFFFQLNLSTLPAECPITPADEMIQLFYCTNEMDGQACELVFVPEYPFSPCIAVRRIPVEDAQSESSFNDSPIMNRVRTITRWKALDDYPAPSEHDELGLLWNFSLDSQDDSSDASEDSLSLECKELDLILNNVDIEFAEKKLHRCNTGDKLLGWPNWIQGADYPECPSCNRRMSFLFQIASEENLNFMFGSCGTAYLFTCNEHPNSLAFAWSSS